jgi:hypothetical protein
MRRYHFDTLAMSKRLQSAGFSEEQSREIVRVIADTQIIHTEENAQALTPMQIAIQIEFLKKGLALVAGGLIFLFGLVILLADRV